MAKHRTHSIEFKRQVSQEFLAGETLHGLAKRHDICRNLIRVWVQKYEAGALNEDVQALVAERGTCFSFTRSGQGPLFACAVRRRIQTSTLVYRRPPITL